MDGGMLMAAFWFVLGAVGYKMMSAMLGYARMLTLSHQTIVGLLTLLRFYAERFEETNSKMVQDRRDEGKENVEELDALVTTAVKVWKEQTVRAIPHFLPPKIRRVYSFRSWDDAMRFLTKYESHYFKRSQ